MRKMLVLLVAAAMLAGCASSIQGAYDDRAQRQCEEENHGRDRLEC
jgi:uncharacterized protein YcfL